MSSVLILSLLPSLVYSWEPGRVAEKDFVVDAENREDVQSFYDTIYKASEGYSNNIGWTGKIAACDAGGTSEEFKKDVQRRVNFYRAMAGLPADIVLDSEKNDACQKAALMMAANGRISHYPDTTWRCWSQEAADAVAQANLSFFYGPGAIDDYIVERGDQNGHVAHRRWILYSRAKEMGTGDIPPGSRGPSPAEYAFNALWVVGDDKPLIEVVPRFVAWPNAGYIPHNLVPGKWSLSHPRADFRQASVKMTRNGLSVPVSVVSRQDNFGDSTIVWQPDVTTNQNRAQDVTYEVAVSDILVDGEWRSHDYRVTAFPTGVDEQGIALIKMLPPKRKVKAGKTAKLVVLLSNNSTVEDTVTVSFNSDNPGILAPESIQVAVKGKKKTTSKPKLTRVKVPPFFIPSSATGTAVITALFGDSTATSTLEIKAAKSRR